MEGKQTHGSFHNRTGLNNNILILDIRKGQIQDIIMPSRHCLPYFCLQQEEPGVYLIDVVDNCECKT